MSTRTYGQGSRALGIVSGYLIKLARHAAGDTQEALAEGLGVDVSTIQGWESGRRSLTALQTGDLVRLRMTLIQRGAPASVARHLENALEADLVLASAIDAGTAWNPHEVHPLGVTVHRKPLTNMIMWPLTSQRPPQLADLTPRTARRGPTPLHPALFADERTRFFDHLLVIADRATGQQHTLLRRQAIYLLSLDARPDTTGWLSDEWNRAVRRPADDLAGMLARRSAAVARAAVGDDEPLTDFVDTLGTDHADTANLNYWAHWVGELPGEQHDDSFMTDVDPRSWAGLRLAEHLVTRIVADSPHLPLNLATLHTLIASRPALLSDWPRLRRHLAAALERVQSTGNQPPRVREQLAGLAYAVRIANRLGVT